MLEYATAAWDPYRAKDINKLDMVQRRAARFVKRETTGRPLLFRPFWINLVGRLFPIDALIADLGFVEQLLLDVWLLAINTDDLVQPSRQTHHSDPDLSFTALAARTDVYKYSFFQEQYVIGTP